MNNINLNHPWQNGPTELIKYAIQHTHKKTDFDSRIAYLMLDVGVETLFKTYLTLPDDITKTQTKFSERKQASEGNFHELVRGVGKAADKKLKDFNLSHIQFYHDLRNKLYHQGNGITIPQENLYAYAQLAVKLLKVLLEVDLNEDLQMPEIETQRKTELILKQQIIDNKKAHVENELEKLKSDIMLVIEIIAPRLALPSFQKNYLSITKKYLVEFINGMDESGNAIYARRVTDNPEEFQKYRKELIELLKSYIENPKLMEDLVKPYSYSFYNSKEVIEAVLLPIALSGYTEANDILFRIIELSVAESSKWLNALEENRLNYLEFQNPFSDEGEKHNAYLNGCDELLMEIKNSRAEIKKWVAVQNAA